MNTYTVEGFFSKKFEVESTNILLNDPSFFSLDLVEDYMNFLMNIDLKDYLQYMIQHPIQQEITTKDITQLSNIDDCTTNMCYIMASCGNKGLTLTEIATALHADNNYKDNTIALTKYGENQAKTAQQLGLVTFYKDLWYLTAVGRTFPVLTKDIQDKFLAVNLLRDPFYSRVISSMITKDTNIRDYMSILSESTQKRRISSCNKVLSFFKNQCNIEDVKLYNLVSK